MNEDKSAKDWRVADLIEEKLIAVNVRSLTFKPERWLIHEPGQHYDIRLTAPNGYVAERSYSAASAPEQAGVVEFGVQILDNGEVSPFLWQMKVGDQVEIRGPIGGHFVWNHTMTGPLILIGGGSGMVPLVSMVRHWQAHLAEEQNDRPVIFLNSCRSLANILYREELEKLAQTNPNFKFITTLTDQAPADWSGYNRRIDEPMLRQTFGLHLDQMPMTYICGPTQFVEVAASLLVQLGLNPHLIKTERFG